jgi:tellurite resistance protein
MSIAGRESLAGLQLLVAVAKADGELTLDERGVIAEALADARLPDGITAGALIGSSSDVDSLIAQIQAQDARDVAFAACVTMADADGVRVPKQQAILDKIETAWAAPAEKRALAGRVLAEECDTVWLTHLEPAADRVKRDPLGRITPAGYERRVVELT